MTASKYKYKYKKSYRTKKKKSIFWIFRNKLFWLGFLILVILGSLFYFFLFSSYFQIKEIKISGNQKIATKEIENIVSQQVNKKIFFFIPRNIFLINFKKIDQTISEKFLVIAKVILKKEFPNTIFVSIEERVAIGVWCKPITDFQESNSDEEEKEKIVLISDSDCFNLDNEGVIFEQSRERTGLIIKSGKEISLGEKVIEKDYLEAILEIERTIKKDSQINIKEFFVPDEGEKLIVKTSDNWEIYFNSTKNISDQVFNLNLVLKEKIPNEQMGNLEYIDLRFGNRVYIKYKNEPVYIPSSDSNIEDSENQESINVIDED